MQTLIKGATLINEGSRSIKDILIADGRIKEIADTIDAPQATLIDAKGLYLMPGLIDDQVHFREPGLTHKACIATESAAAAAGGVTSFMEMPNTNPQTLTQELLEEKYDLGAKNARVNYSFFMGASNDNLEEVLKTDFSKVCGLKVFMGSSTGNMLVDSKDTLEAIFKDAKGLIAVHCEDEPTVRKNMERMRAKYGELVPMSAHPWIRSEEACYLSSSLAVELAKKYGARLHVLHISTAKELSLFSDAKTTYKKRITAEACIHHLWFSEKDYLEKGALIKWNPAVKTPADREALRNAILTDRIDVIATDHAPHTWEEKQKPYLSCPSGGPLVQHSLVALLDMMHAGLISLEQIARKTAHMPAEIFRIKDRGYIRPGYFADIVLVDLDSPWEVTEENILAQCGWSPFIGHTFKSEVKHTFVNGDHVFDNGKINQNIRGQRLSFHTGD
jgi:dihydroorotase